MALNIKQDIPNNANRQACARYDAFKEAWLSILLAG
jgi:hypothetical protein